MQLDFEFILSSHNCPNPDEILANIVRRGGNVELKIYRNHLIARREVLYMVRNSYFELFRALLYKNQIAGCNLNALLMIAARYDHLEFCELAVNSGANVNFVDDLIITTLL